MAAPSPRNQTGRLHRLWQVMRAAHDPDTEEGRTLERRRRLILSAAASGVARLIAMAASLVSVPLTLHYLGAELYGMWMVIASFTAMLAFADLGLGNGILTRIAEEYGRDNRAQMAGIISNGYVATGAMAAVVLAGFAIAYPFVPWPALFNASSQQAREQAGPALAVFTVCFALSIPGSVVQKVQTGLQQSFVSSLWQALGSVLALVAVLGVIALRGSLPWLVLALAGCPMVVGWVNTLAFFGRSAPDLRPVMALASREALRSVVSIGLLFFTIQLIGSIKYGSDTLMLAQLKGAASVAQYAVPERLFSVIAMVITMVTAPLWPAYGEAIARGDARWVRHVLRRSLLLAGLCAAVASSALVLAAPFIIRLWVGGAVTPTTMLLVGLGLWRVVEACGTAASFYMNGAGLMRSQAWIAGFTALAMITLKIVLITRMGAAGIAWGATVSFVLCSGLPITVIIRRDIARRQGTQA
jgi:O-antigen/teichoic acid export membrane protein